MSEEKSELEAGVLKETAIKALRDAVIGKGDEVDPLILPLFVGALSDTHKDIYKTAAVYNAYRQALAQENKGMELGEDRTAKALKVNFDNLAKEHFPDMEEKDLIPMLINYIRFIYSYSDRLMLRDDNNDILTQDNFVNTLPGNNDTRIPPISAVRPSNDKSLSVRDRMRRNLRGARGEPDTFNIILLNSLIFLRVEIPSPTDLIRLINSIGTRLENYGERYNITSIHLERAGISELLIDFVLDRLKYHSVKDVMEPYELKEYILANDINPIVMALLCTTAPKGVSFRMYCVANKCQHNEVMIIDPTAMVLNIEEHMDEDRREVLFQVVNKGRKLSREELAKYRPVYKDQEGKALDTVVPIKDVGRLNIAVPTLSEYFDTFHVIRDRINPEIRQLAVDFPNLQQFKEKRAEWLSSIRGSEYLQWFTSIEYDPQPNTEGEKEVITREEDPRSFEEGLLDIFGDDEELYMDALQKVIKTVPRMTFTYIGICNDSCPACKEDAEGIDHELIKGFTPIDPVMNFFDRTRMMIGMRATEANIVEEGLS